MSEKDVEKLKEDTKNNLLHLQNAMPDATTADSYTPEQAAEINQKVSTYVESTFSEPKALSTESANVGLSITEACLSDPEKIVEVSKKEQILQSATSIVSNSLSISHDDDDDNDDGDNGSGENDNSGSGDTSSNNDGTAKKKKRQRNFGSSSI